MYKRLPLILAILGIAFTNNTYAAIVNMTGNVSFDNHSLNFNPIFNNGDTIVVSSPGTMNIPFGKNNTVIQALVTNNQVSSINIDPNRYLTIGSISGANKVGSININANYAYSSYLLLTGTAGENNIISANDYSGLKRIYVYNYANAAAHLQGSYITINAPITLDALIDVDTGCRSNLNINNKVILNNTVTINNKNMTTSISQGNSLTLNKEQGLVSKSGGQFVFNIGENSNLNINGNNITIPGTINFNGSAARLNINGTGTSIIGNQNLQNPIINLGTNQLEFRGDVTTAGTMTLIVKHNNVLDGRIKITDGNLDLSQLDNLMITPIVNLHDMPDKHYSYKLIEENGGTITPISVDKIIIDDKEQLNRYVNYSVNGDLILHLTNIADAKLQNDVNDWSNIPDNQYASEEVHAVDQLINMNNNLPTDRVLFINNLGFSTPIRAKETLDKVITAIPPKNNYVIHHIGTMLAINNSHLNRRMSPVSAGSEDWKKDFGMWVSPVYNSSKQEENSGVSGYKAKSQGIMFGADTVINDSYLVGLAYGQVFNKMTYRNLKAGDNTKNIMHIFSLYGSNNASSAWFTEGILSYANSRIKNRSNRLIYDGSVGVALGKYKSRAYSGQLVEGYNFYYDKNITFSPVVGVRYAGIRDKSYIEQNTSFQNLSVRGIKYNKFEGIVGLRGTVHKEYNNWLLIPSVYTYLDYTFKGKVPNVPVIVEGVKDSLITKHSKLSKTLLTLGGNLRIQGGKIEFGFTYDSFLAKKYHAYQVSMNAKVHL